ncbi:hypothetical protein PSGL111025_12605 [Psychrobacter glaciei]|jgi:hypothetical protein
MTVPCIKVKTPMLSTGVLSFNISIDSETNIKMLLQLRVVWVTQYDGLFAVRTS